MFQSERMKKVNILALARDIDALVIGLGSLRAIHLTPPAKDSEGKLLTPSDRTGELERLRALEHRIERVASILNVSLDLARPELREEFATPEEVAGALDRLEPEIDRVVEGRQALTEEAAELRRIIAQVETFEGTTLTPARIGEFSFVHFALGAIPEQRLKSVQDAVEERVLLVPFKDASGRQKVLALTSKKGRWALDATLTEHGFQPEELKEEFPGLPDEVLVRARRRLAEVLGEDDELRRHLQTLGAMEETGLRRFWRHLRIRQKILQAHENIGRTQSTYLVSGWVPAHMVETFVNRVLELTEHRALIEMHDPEELSASEEPPSSLKHSWLTRPFALLVSGYGHPRYGEIEPTVLVAVSFLLMFGAMFGDVGQGAVLLLVGLAMFFWIGRPTTKDFGMLIALCGVSAILFGFVYGSVFGKERLIRPLWASPMSKVMLLLQLSIGVGIVIISLGVLLNVVNKFRTGNWASAVFDRFGLAGIAFYWGALGLLIKLALGVGVSPMLAVTVILISLAVIFLKEPIHFALSRGGRESGGAAEKRQGGPGGFFVAVVEGFVEVLEAFLMYTANTASFVRLGAYALSHAGLCLVIFALGDAVSGAAGGAVWSILLVVVGNAVVIALEGLVVAVQTLRLEYYEFFNKFFSGEGRVYKPFDLQSEES
ncbi:MAG: hypothetical protein AMK75_02030 [Planctomycetes bacterium SM23_65]|nr:MAG: hypothetical protein AMK75_02030 [Planctomycetes bacterium SM23_65]